MSSSSPPLVPSVISRELRSSASSRATNGSSASPRVFDNMHQTPGGMEHDQGADFQPPDVPIGASNKRGLAHRMPAYVTQGSSRANRVHSVNKSGGYKVSTVASASAASASAQSQGPAAASLNPLAREFVPGATVSPPIHEGFITSMGSGDLSATSQDGSQRVSGVAAEGMERESTQSLQDKGPRRSGGLATVLQQGQTGQGRTGSSLRSGQGGTDGNSNQSLAGPGKRGQFVNANHLLNFQYDPIVRPPLAQRVSFARKPHKSQPFNKELFLQANFRFLVSDFGDYLVNSLDPDKMLQWEDITAVNVSAPVPIQCPICLEVPPVCPQITSCGHIFCFPCILRYFVMGENEQRSEIFKKCPLCFAVTSSKALRTVFVDSVHNYQVGDMLELTLLNRSKGSIIPFKKSEGIVVSLPYSKDGQFHPFSKFTLTSDADQTTNKAIAELSSWAETAQNEGEEDVDLIPFALLGMEHLQQRRAAWNDHRASEFLSSSPPVRQRIMAQLKDGGPHSLSHGSKTSDGDNERLDSSKKGSEGKQVLDVASETAAAMADLKGRAGWVYENAFSDDEVTGQANDTHNMPNGNAVELDQTAGLSSSWEDTILEKTNVSEKLSFVSKDIQETSRREEEEDEFYAFFQSADGQPLVMHPLNMKCLLQHYGSYDNLPSRLHVRIIEMESQTQSDALRKRYRYLSHLPLTTNIWFCEVDLRGTLPSSAFTPFTDELRFREARRRRRQKQEQVERLREERMTATLSRISPPAISLVDDHNKDMPLLISGSSESNMDSNAPTPVPSDQRKLFSQVTRLGFASAHDAPDLTTVKGGESRLLLQEKPSSSAWNGASSKSSAMSFADIIQTQPLKVSSPVASGAHAPNQQSGSKKSKKASKILLSTAGGRRY